MSAARKAIAREYAPGEREAEDVRNVCSTDPARARLLTPFSAAIRGRGMICGTNVVTVWGSEPLAPFAFTSGTKSIAESPRIAVVMPMRI
jgi:hypothetical protein